MVLVNATILLPVSGKAVVVKVLSGVRLNNILKRGITQFLFLFRTHYTSHNEIKRKEVTIMFTKIAIYHLRNRIEKIDNEDERLRANAFLNLIEQFLKKNA